MGAGAVADFGPIGTGVGGDEQWTYAAVYDGHGGMEVVEYVARRMHEIILTLLKTVKKIQTEEGPDDTKLEITGIPQEVDIQMLKQMIGMGIKEEDITMPKETNLWEGKVVHQLHVLSPTHEELKERHQGWAHVRFADQKTALEAMERVGKLGEVTQKVGLRWEEEGDSAEEIKVEANDSDLASTDSVLPSTSATHDSTVSTFAESSSFVADTAADISSIFVCIVDAPSSSTSSLPADSAN